MILLTAVGTVVFMPIAVPRLIPGLDASAWTIGKPLLLLVLAPLMVGLVIRRARESVATRAAPIVRKVAGLATIVLLVSMIALHGDEFVAVAGSGAILAQVLLLGSLGIGSHLLGFGLLPARRSVLCLGICTRNLGAALAPLLALASPDPKAVLMIVLAVPTTVLLASAGAVLYGRQHRGAAPAEA